MKLIALDGFPGSGKTTVSGMLSELLEIEHLQLQNTVSSVVNRLMNNFHHLTNNDLQQLLNTVQIVYAANDEKKGEKIIWGKRYTLISDEFLWYIGDVYRTGFHKILSDILDFFQIDPIVFFLNIPIEVSAERISERFTARERYAYKIDISAQDIQISKERRKRHAEEYRTYSQHYPKVFDFPIVEIDATPPVDQVVDSIIEYLLERNII